MLQGKLAMHIQCKLGIKTNCCRRVMYDTRRQNKMSRWKAGRLYGFGKGHKKSKTIKVVKRGGGFHDDDDDDAQETYVQMIVVALLSRRSHMYSTCK